VIEHFRIRSIPPRTGLDALRERRSIESGRGSGGNPLSSSLRIGGFSLGQSLQRRLEQDPGGFNVKDHVFRKPTKEKPKKSLIIPGAERITWEVEVHEDCGAQGSLRVIMQFSGIGFTNAPVFEKSRVDYGQNSRVFFSRIGYKNGSAFLILATYGDIFESQVVAARIDMRPFFREETRLPQLTVTHDPISMAVNEKNHLVVVSYNKL